MNVQIQMTRNETGRFYVLATEKGGMSVSLTRGYANVCFHNAAAALHRNLGGKTFFGTSKESLGKAIAAYKSEAAQAMLAAVLEAEKNEPVLSYGT